MNLRLPAFHGNQDFYSRVIFTGEKEIKLQKRGGAEIIGIATSEKDSGESGTTRSKQIVFLYRILVRCSSLLNLGNRLYA